MRADPVSDLVVRAGKRLVSLSAIKSCGGICVCVKGERKEEGGKGGKRRRGRGASSTGVAAQQLRGESSISSITRILGQAATLGLKLVEDLPPPLLQSV